MKYKFLLLLQIVVIASGCSLNYASDQKLQNWLAEVEARCISQYGDLPIKTSEQRTYFNQLSYQTYYRELPREVYADRLNILYPNHRLAINCLASAMPAD